MFDEAKTEDDERKATRKRGGLKTEAIIGVYWKREFPPKKMEMSEGVNSKCDLRLSKCLFHETSFCVILFGDLHRRHEIFYYITHSAHILDIRSTSPK